MPKSKKGSVIILVCDMSSHPILPNNIKIFQRVFKLLSGHEINFKNKGRELQKKARVVILVCDTSLPGVNFY